MNLIKNAIVFRATLPGAEALAQHLAEKPFSPALEAHYSSSGFIQHPTTGELVSSFPGGIAFRLRRDFKPVSKAAIKLALSEKVTATQSALGRELSKEEVETMMESIAQEALKNTLPERSELDAFYHIESRTLILPTTSRDTASVMVAMLVEACGSVETSTIHVSNVKGGLTARLRNYFQEDDKEAFAGFSIGDSVLMKGKKGRASFDLDNLDHARQGVLEALNGEMQAERLELCHADLVNFKLTKEFQLRGISFIADEREEEPEFETTEELWLHTAGVQTLLLVATVSALCDLFGYKEKTGGDQPEAADHEVDPLFAEAVEFVRDTQRASVSAIQRKLSIGYNRAARIIEEMELQGIVSPMNSHGSRDVIIKY